MILPIVAYGDPVLKKVAAEISSDFPNLDTLIADMWETMYHAEGVGLAAPQIGKSISLFVIDGAPFSKDEDLTPAEQVQLTSFKKVFINAKILEEAGVVWSFTEGCLSIPDIREDVQRHEELTIRYQDEKFDWHTEKFTGLAARIVQHEYDHIEGVLFTDKLSSLKKRLIKGKLDKIAKGLTQADYRMKYYQPKKR